MCNKSRNKRIPIEIGIATGSSETAQLTVEVLEQFRPRNWRNLMFVCEIDIWKAKRAEKIYH